MYAVDFSERTGLTSAAVFRFWEMTSCLSSVLGPAAPNICRRFHRTGEEVFRVSVGGPRFASGDRSY